MTEPFQLDFESSRALLESYQIPVLGRVVQTPDEAVAAAESIGFPVVIKALSKKIVHKTDLGAVVLGLKTAERLRLAYFQMIDRLARAGFPELDGVLVQKMVDPGFELLIGAKQDPCFGPVTMVGTGGKYVELFKDVSPGIGVLEPDDVMRMLDDTKAGCIINGFRQTFLDRQAVIDLCTAVSRLMDQHPEIHEIDLNPVMVYEKGFAIVDVRVIQGGPVTYTRHSDLSPAIMESLDNIFNLKSVAIVGASRTGSIGGIILKNCRRIPKVYPVNPKMDVVQGLKSYPDLTSLPEVPDVAIFAVNPERTVAGFEEFCKMGGKGAIIVTDGFAESGRRDLESRLAGLSREYGVAYIGPNCLGALDNFSGLSTLFIPAHRTSTITEPNGIGVISQSGGIGLELLEMLDADGLKIGKWVSCGNSSSVGAPEILDHMGRDDRIEMIAIYLEGLSEGMKLMEIGRKVSRLKPVIIIKGGVGGGAEATMSHTASLAGSHEAFRACCHQAGFYLLQELTEDPKILANVLSLLANMPQARGNRVGVVSVGGGAAILLADQVTEEGMVLSEFAPETKEKLRELLKDNIKVSSPGEQEAVTKRLGLNPLDLFGNCDDKRLMDALKIVDKDPNTDIVIAAPYLQVPYLSEYINERLVDLKKELTKPLIISPRGFSNHVARSRAYLRSKGFATYTVPMMKPIKVALQIWKDYDRSFMQPESMLG